MHRTIFGLSFLGLLGAGAALAACSSSVDPTTGAGSTTGATTSATSGAGGASTSGGTGGSASTSGGTGGSGGAATTTTTTSSGTGGQMEVPAYQSYVVLGDSISDGGGQGPFFYDLLVTNDDNAYPTWQGKDLKTKFGAGLQVVHNAKGGAVSGNLPGQVSNLPDTLPGPVLVTITIGGNDMQANIFSILQGTDGPKRDKFRMNLAAALGELTKPDRFGPGVEVHVFEADIYDPSDGKGDFSKHGCPAPLSLLPVTPTDTFFANWNGVVDDEVPMHGMSKVSPLHMTFYGHGIGNADDRWFANDCIHPNKKGHNELRRMFWANITGEVVP
ncbi:MAG: SGNH/GDSL hydrolase family protein [Byssovorax sp.]